MIIPQMMQTRERVGAVMTSVIADKPAEVKSQTMWGRSSKRLWQTGVTQYRVRGMA
jgi:hypothetical protein